MHTKQALLENINSLSPEAKGALIGSLIGAGGMGLAGVLGSRKHKLRSGLLGLLGGGLGGGALGYFGGGGTMQGLKDKVKNPFAGQSPKPGKLPTGYQDTIPPSGDGLA